MAREVIADTVISDAYIYLLGRLLVTRQQRLHFENEGFAWNQFLHRRPGDVDAPNPNLDVACSEAWVAVDGRSCTLVSVPRITGRYSTVQVLNGWGETLATIDERAYPAHRSGEFALCRAGATVPVPLKARRIDLPGPCARVLARVELGTDWDRAIALQHQLRLRTIGKPALPEIPKTPMFELDRLPGVEAFDAAEVALDSEPDTNPGMEALQAHVRAIAQAVRDPAEHARVDHVIRERTAPDLVGAMMRHGTVRNGWVRPAAVGLYGTDYLSRTLANHGGLWANSDPQVVTYRCHVDGDGAVLDGKNFYALTFAADEVPAVQATYCWSVMALDSKRFRVLPNPMSRFVINTRSTLRDRKDGSLTLYFAPDRPRGVPDGNWLPTATGQVYGLTLRFYGPTSPVAAGRYVPPPVVKQH